VLKVKQSLAGLPILIKPRLRTEYRHLSSLGLEKLSRYGVAIGLSVLKQM